MDFRTVADLQQSIVRGAYACRDADLIVGIPRSGLLAANLLALHLNKPLTDITGLSERRLLTSGHRLRAEPFAWEKLNCVAVIDDSLYSGTAIAEARKLVTAVDSRFQVKYGVVYLAPGHADKVDFYFEECAMPRFFEWNFMHHSHLKNSCVDIDGVLCVDPTEKENDDGRRYERFLQHAAPLHLPTVRIAKLVTCRLEKFRSQTEEWLARHGVEYGELIMLDLPDGASRRRWGRYGEYKGEVFRRATDCNLFIESSLRQSLAISDKACKPVFCVETGATVYPSRRGLLRGVARKVPKQILRRAKFIQSSVGRWLNERAREWSIHE